LEVFKRQSVNYCLLIVFIIIINWYVTGKNLISKTKRIEEQCSVYWMLLIMLFCLHTLEQCRKEFRVLNLFKSFCNL